jgi:quercetin dioxygenase-like cupin family protein
MHKHPDHVVYVVTGGKLKVSPSEGAAKDFDLKAGQAVFLNAEAHAAENTGTTELKLAVFELRAKSGTPGPKGADPAVAAKKNYKQIFDNERVRVFEVTFAKGAKLPVHRFLMIGFTPAMAYATPIISAPAITKLGAGLANSPRACAMPAIAPSRTLTQAGQVESSPSGSKTTLPPTGQYGKKWFTPMTVRSM